ncbi:MAG: OadG family protein [Thermodesulfobacteriota bacterium]
MSFENIGLSNLFAANFNALWFSLMGMGVVFGGLVVIALYIVFLPRLLKLSDRKKNIPVESAGETTGDKTQREKEMLLAVAAAYHLHRNFPEDNERITWKSHGDMESPWRVSGRLHGLSVRRKLSSWGLSE